MKHEKFLISCNSLSQYYGEAVTQSGFNESFGDEFVSVRYYKVAFVEAFT